MVNEPPAPVMDVSTPPTPKHDEVDKKHEAKPESKDKSKAKVGSKAIQPKNNNSVTTAIVATVFIVFGLAALATYAYFKSTT